MSAQSHKPCYGTIFHDTLNFQENMAMRGKVFSFELDRIGLGRSNRLVGADMTEWDDCLDCEEFEHCYRFCIGKLLLQTAIEHE